MPIVEGWNVVVGDKQMQNSLGSQFSSNLHKYWGWFFRVYVLVSLSNDLVSLSNDLEFKWAAAIEFRKSGKRSNLISRIGYYGQVGTHGT